MTSAEMTSSGRETNEEVGDGSRDERGNEAERSDRGGAERTSR